MKIAVNHKEYDVSENTSVHQLLSILELKPQGIAIAINNTIIPKSFWQNTSLTENAQITIIKATQGG